jgi:hypothetical protein
MEYEDFQSSSYQLAIQESELKAKYSLNNTSNPKFSVQTDKCCQHKILTWSVGVVAVLFITAVIAVAFIAWQNIATEHSRDMRLVRLSQSEGVCNDGSQPSFYFRPGQGNESLSWVIVLQGFSEPFDFCFDSNSCYERSHHHPESISTSSDPQYLYTDNLGILSRLEDENPIFYQSTHVYIRYCSSDSWVGESANPTPWDYYFQGRIIFHSVLSYLSSQYGLFISSCSHSSINSF